MRTDEVSGPKIPQSYKMYAEIWARRLEAHRFHQANVGKLPKTVTRPLRITEECSIQCQIDNSIQEVLRLLLLAALTYLNAEELRNGRQLVG